MPAGRIRHCFAARGQHLPRLILGQTKNTAFLLTVRGNAVFFAEKSVVASPQFFISQGLVADLVQQVPIAVRVLVVAEREPPVAGLVLHREGRAPKLRASTQCR